MSGAICALFAINVAMWPSQKFSIMFIPAPLEGQQLLGALACVDAAMLVYCTASGSVLRWGHHAHLVGIAVGLSFAHCYLLPEMQRRQKVFQSPSSLFSSAWTRWRGA